MIHPWSVLGRNYPQRWSVFGRRQHPWQPSVHKLRSLARWPCLPTPKCWSMGLKFVLGFRSIQTAIVEATAAGISVTVKSIVQYPKFFSGGSNPIWENFRIFLDFDQIIFSYSFLTYIKLIFHQGAAEFLLCFIPSTRPASYSSHRQPIFLNFSEVLASLFLFI